MDMCVHPKHIMYDDVPLCRVTACSHRGLRTNKSHRFNLVFSIGSIRISIPKKVCASFDFKNRYVTAVGLFE